MVQALLPLLALFAQQSAFDFHAYGPYSADVLKPEQVLGYGPGDRHTTYYQQEKVVTALLKSDRVAYLPYGVSVEGRPLRLLAISSPANIKNLQTIRGRLEALAGGRTDRLEETAKDTPAIVWINETIHGNEPASFESGMWLAYNLIASNHPDILGALDKVVVILNPSYNPDGHERYVVWYNSVAVGSPRREAFEMREVFGQHGRGNHYRFDMNRDRVAMSQDETRQEVAAFLHWNPQVYVDQHGQVDGYFFPPVAMSVNANVDRERYERWTSVLGKATAASFDKQGWNYFVRDVFDFYYPGYLDTWTTLSGAIGMTHETEGGLTRSSYRSDETELTLRDGMAKHFTSALAVIRESAANREALLRSYAKFKADATEGKNLGKDRYLFVQGAQLKEFCRRLSHSGISYYIPAGGKRSGRNFWTSQPEAFGRPEGKMAVVIDLAQPQGALAKSLVELKSDFEPEFVKEQLRRREQEKADEKIPGGDPLEFYDITAWNAVLGHQLDAWWADEKPEEAGMVQIDQPQRARGGKVGWIADPTEATVLAAAKLMSDGVRIQVTTKAMTVGGNRHPAGSLIVFRDRNEAGVEKLLEEHGAGFGPLETGYPDEGREGPGLVAQPLRAPDIGVVFGDMASPTSFGSIWYAMERGFKLPFTPLHSNALNGDLSKYTCIVFPPGRYAPVSDKLKEWIRNGGVAVLLGNWDWVTGEKGLVQFQESKLAKDATPGYVPGALFRANLDRRSFLSWGYERNELAVPIEGTQFFKARKEGGGAITLSSDDKTTKLLSGWVWPDDSEKALAGTVWLHDEPIGSGRLILFAQDPTDRALYPGLHQLLLNAMVLGARS